jgi:hypothetical protein
VERFDLVTPTEREARDDGVAKRRRRYFAVMIPCIVLVVFGFFIPAPVPLRLVALVIASFLLIIGVIVGNAAP